MVSPSKFENLAFIRKTIVIQFVCVVALITYTVLRHYHLNDPGPAIVTGTLIATSYLAVTILMMAHHLDLLDEDYGFVDVLGFVFEYGFTLQFVYNVTKNKKKLIREAEMYFRQGRYKDEAITFREFKTWRRSVEMVYLYELCKFQDYLDEVPSFQKSGRERRREARVYQVTSRVMENAKDHRPTLAREKAKVDPLSELQRICDDLERRADKSRLEICVKALTLIEDLRTSKFGTRSYRQKLYKIERLLDSSEQEVSVPEKKRTQEVSLPTQKTEITSRDEELPTHYTWDSTSGSVVYSDSFCEMFDGLKPEEKRQVIKQISFLSTEGLMYPSLKTKRVYAGSSNSPMGEYVSRGARHLRFSWSKSADLTVHTLFYRKNFKGAYFNAR